MKAHDIFNALFGLVIAAIFLVIAFRCLRSGKSGPQIDLPDVSANRATNPKLFWMFLAAYGTVAAMGLSFSLFSFTNTTLPVIGATLFFGASFAIRAAATGFYTIYGFQTDKALLVYRGVSIYDRDQSPKWFWATQIQNIVMTAFFGVIGIGAMVFAIWVEFWS
jgi:hypothetical protein